MSLICDHLFTFVWFTACSAGMVTYALVERLT